MELQPCDKGVMWVSSLVGRSARSPWGLQRRWRAGPCLPAFVWVRSTQLLGAVFETVPPTSPPSPPATVCTFMRRPPSVLAFCSSCTCSDTCHSLPGRCRAHSVCVVNVDSRYWHSLVVALNAAKLYAVPLAGVVAYSCCSPSGSQLHVCVIDITNITNGRLRMSCAFSCTVFICETAFCYALVAYSVMYNVFTPF